MVPKKSAIVPKYRSLKLTLVLWRFGSMDYGTVVLRDFGPMVLWNSLSTQKNLEVFFYSVILYRKNLVRYIVLILMNLLLLLRCHKLKTFL
jgi:hypothetical protein